MNMETIEQEILYSNLVHLGNYYSLDGMIDRSLFKKEVKEFDSNWHPYNPDKLSYKRDGLSLTSLDGKMDGEELTSLLEYNKKHGTSFSELDFKQPTEALKKLTCLRTVIEPFLPHLGRTHLLRLNEGGFFPPHRDSQEVGTESFRLISLIDNCEASEFHFIYDDEKINLSPCRLYFMNTKITHSLFSFTDNNIFFVANVHLNEKSAASVINNLESK
jgi:hypothetical protein